MNLFEPCTIISARRIPAGFRSNCQFQPFAPLSEGSGAPKFAAADRRGRWSALRRDPSRLRNGIAGP